MICRSSKGFLTTVCLFLPSWNNNKSRTLLSHTCHFTTTMLPWNIRVEEGAANIRVEEGAANIRVEEGAANICVEEGAASCAVTGDAAAPSWPLHATRPVLLITLFIVSTHAGVCYTGVCVFLIRSVMLRSRSDGSKNFVPYLELRQHNKQCN